jgi:hypothetical protein
MYSSWIYAIHDYLTWILKNKMLMKISWFTNFKAFLESSSGPSDLHLQFAHSEDQILTDDYWNFQGKM